MQRDAVPIALTAMHPSRSLPPVAAAPPRCFLFVRSFLLLHQPLCVISSSCLARARRPSTRLQSWLQRLQHTNREVRGDQQEDEDDDAKEERRRCARVAASTFCSFSSPLHICHASL